MSRQLYAILRMDFNEADSVTISRDMSTWSSGLGDSPSPACITGTKAFDDIEGARDYARQLNDLNAEKDARYFVVVVRPSDAG